MREKSASELYEVVAKELFEEPDPWCDLPPHEKEVWYEAADTTLSAIVEAAEEGMPILRELGPDVDANFGQEVWCDILPKYIQSQDEVLECYEKIIGLAYSLADYIVNLERKACIDYLKEQAKGEKDGLALLLET